MTQDAKQPIVDLPEDVGVRCPKESNSCIPVKRCEGCFYCAGLAHAYANPKLHFARQYMVRCGFPIDRELMQLSGFSAKGGE